MIVAGAMQLAGVIGPAVVALVLVESLISFAWLLHVAQKVFLGETHAGGVRQQRPAAGDERRARRPDGGLPGRAGGRHPAGAVDREVTAMSTLDLLATRDRDAPRRRAASSLPLARQQAADRVVQRRRASTLAASALDGRGARGRSRRGTEAESACARPCPALGGGAHGRRRRAVGLLPRDRGAHRRSRDALLGRLHDALPQGDGLAKFYPVLLVFFAAIVGVLVVSDFLFFLVCWELMTLTSFVLVTFERERTRRASARG